MDRMLSWRWFAWYAALPSLALSCALPNVTTNFETGRRELRVLLIGESPCEYSPILQHNFFSRTLCPPGYDCHLSIDCVSPKGLLPLANMVAGITNVTYQMAFQKDFARFYTSPDTVLARECATNMTPHVVLIHLGLSVNWGAGLLPQEQNLMMQAIRGTCPWSITFATSNPAIWKTSLCNNFTYQDYRIRISCQGHFKTQTFNAGFQQLVLANGSHGCPSEDYLHIAAAEWNTSDYGQDNLHYCYQVPANETCMTATRIGRILAHEATSKLRALANLLNSAQGPAPDPNQIGQIRADTYTRVGYTGVPAADSRWISHGYVDRHEHTFRLAIVPKPSIATSSVNTSNVTTQCNIAFEEGCSGMFNLLLVLLASFCVMQLAFFCLLLLPGMQERSFNEMDTHLDPEVDEQATPRPQQPRLPSLEGSRVIAVAHIVCFHLVYPGCNGAFCGALWVGRLWVQWFFVLSGFVTAWGDKPDEDGLMPWKAIAGLKKRTCAVYPTYLVALLLDPRVWTTLIHTKMGLYLITTYLFFVQTWVPPFAQDPPNGPGWFLSCLFAFWIASPFWLKLLKLYSQTGLWVMIGICWAFCAVPDLASSAVGFEIQPGSWYGIAVHHLLAFSPLTNWHFFLVGIAAGLLASNGYTAGTECGCGKMRQWCAIGQLFGAFSICLAMGEWKTSHPLFLDRGLWSLPMWLILSWILVDQDSPVSKALSYLEPFAEYAFPVFILHIPISNMLRIFTQFEMPCGWLIELISVVTGCIFVQWALQCLMCPTTPSRRKRAPSISSQELTSTTQRDTYSPYLLPGE